MKNMQQSFGSIKEIILRGNQKFFSKDFDNLLFNVNEQARKLMILSEIPKNLLETITVIIISVLVITYSYSDDDIINLDKYTNKFKKLSFVYVDCNIYEVVKKILLKIDSKLSHGAIIAFDEAQHPDQKGEGKALMEFYKKNKKKYKLIKINKKYQPDALLIKK